MADYYLMIVRSTREADPPDLQDLEWRYQPGEVISMIPATYFDGTPAEGLAYPFSDFEKNDPHIKWIVVNVPNDTVLNILKTLLLHDTTAKDGNHPVHYYRKRVNQFDPNTMHPAAKSAVFDSPHDTLSRVNPAHLTVSALKPRSPRSRVQL